MVKFEVKVVGHPKPEVKWLKQGEEILPSDEFQIENLDDGTSILVINDVYPDDAGEIKFEAFNSIGTVETVSEFVVEGNNSVSKISYLETYFNFSENLFQLKLVKICSNPNFSIPFVIFIKHFLVYSLLDIFVIIIL